MKRKIPKILLFLLIDREIDMALIDGLSRYRSMHEVPAFYLSDLQRNYWELPPTLEKMAQLKALNANGIIMRETEALKRILKLGLPTIVFPYNHAYITEINVPHLPLITVDNAAIGEMGAEHLLKKGFKNFAFCGFDDTIWSKTREEFFCRKIAERGFETAFYGRPITTLQPYKGKEQTSLAKWLETLPLPVGLMAANDHLGLQITKACQNSGLKIPEEVAVLGVSNHRLLCKLGDPPLSSIALSCEKAGYDSAVLMDRLMNGEKMKGQKIIIQPMHVVTRRSSDISIAEDTEVQHALNFIHRHREKLIRVTDVVNSTGLSRRQLEKRFKKTVGRSILGEITRGRVEHMAITLIETHLPVEKIAMFLGYRDATHMARYFRREKGLSPLAYRKKYSI